MHTLQTVSLQDIPIRREISLKRFVCTNNAVDSRMRPLKQCNSFRDPFLNSSLESSPPGRKALSNSPRHSLKGLNSDANRIPKAWRTLLYCDRMDLSRLVVQVSL